MSEKLEFTGERFTPECEREIWYEHFHRYAFAARLCEGATVLDAACGEGYGSALLSRTAGSVTGVDISEQAITHARDRYADIEGLSFEVASVTCLPFEDASFDRIVSFETLEHLAEQEEMLAEFRRVLKPEGLLLLSSPDKAVYTDEQGFENEYHVRELYREELERLIAPVFPASRLLGQKLMFHSVIWSEEGVERAVVQTHDENDGMREAAIAQRAVYFIVVCAANEEHLPALSGKIWLFSDSTESVYRHYHHEIRKNMAAGGIIAERDRELEVLKHRLNRAEQPWWRRWLGRT